MNSNEQDYILLSKLFGLCLDMVQGKGGNISVKDNTILIVKQSGFCMDQTTVGKGYVHCDLEQIKQKFAQKDENLVSTVVKGQGRPSMETFFHSLPPKYIVHLHPTSCMNLLCESDLRCLQSLFSDSLCLPYVQPGYELSDLIHKVWTGQSVVFLQNHGVIFLEETMDTLIDTIHRTFSRLQAKQMTDISFLYSLYLKDKTSFWKPSFLIPCVLPRVKSLTPDYHLFLVNEIKSKILLHKGVVYVQGSSKESVELLEQMYASYFLCHFDFQSREIPGERAEELEQNPLEKERLSK